ncbi:MAG: phosphoribosylamine--glycine ligase [Sphingomonadaceae bacterium]|nr:phosphoribosylamine--glycine ligase [Sphingomonadaceae bacterium]
MNLLVIGSGGREHALCWKLRQSARVDRLFCAPGNAGIAAVAECMALADNEAIIAFARANAIGLVVVGPEAPLVGGLVDALRSAGIAAFGPSAAAARLEGSKGFTKALCARANIPTAAFARFDSGAAARDYVAAHPLPVVIKADGLAAGKGVVIAHTREEAAAALEAMPGPVVIEAFLTGTEASLFVLCDDENIVPLGSAQDYKRVGDGDTGSNTGGMGAVSPAPALTPALERRALAEIVAPTIATMAAMGTPFTGVLFAGLMLTADGPQLIEYNVRFGDPECEALMVRLESDLLDLLLAASEGRLADTRPAWREGASVTVIMAAEGYPAAPITGSVIGGVEAAEATGAVVFHAGTSRRDDGALVASGGRVLAVTATGRDVGGARRAAYAAVDSIDWPGGFCRRDIAGLWASGIGE